MFHNFRFYITKRKGSLWRLFCDWFFCRLSVKNYTIWHKFLDISSPLSGRQIGTHFPPPISFGMVVLYDLCSHKEDLIVNLVLGHHSSSVNHYFNTPAAATNPKDVFILHEIFRFPFETTHKHDDKFVVILWGKSSPASVCFVFISTMGGSRVSIN